MEKLIKNNKNRIVRFSTLGMKTGMVSASSTREMKLGRHSIITGCTFTMNTERLAGPSSRLSGLFRYYSTSSASLWKGSTTLTVCTDNTNNPNLHSVITVACYPNADTQKQTILKENKGKAGVYRWVNLINGKTYLGSSGNLSDRFLQYFNVKYLERKIKKDNSKIYNSILKNGFSNFKLEILEYCELSVLNEREQYYIDTLNPEYNILKFARSFRGFKHSEASIKLMKAKYELWDKYVSPETRKKQVITQLKGVSTIVINAVTKEEQYFIS